MSKGKVASRCKKCKAFTSSLALSSPGVITYAFSISSSFLADVLHLVVIVVPVVPGIFSFSTWYLTSFVLDNFSEFSNSNSKFLLVLVLRRSSSANGTRVVRLVGIASNGSSVDS